MTTATTSTPPAPAKKLTTDELLALLIATNPAILFNYTVMAVLEGAHSVSSIEHRFRAHRTRAKEILEQAGDFRGLDPVGPRRRRAPTTAATGAEDDGGDGGKAKGKGRAREVVGEEKRKRKRVRVNEKVGSDNDEEVVEVTMRKTKRAARGRKEPVVKVEVKEEGDEDEGGTSQGQMKEEDIGEGDEEPEEQDIKEERSAMRAIKHTSRRQQRRPASSTQPPEQPSGHASSAGHHSPTQHAHHPEPANESLGRGFYLTLAALPLSFAVYKFSRSSPAAADSTADAAQPLPTRIINRYSSYKEAWTRRNTLHTKLIEQAAHDRNLFQSSPGSKAVDLKFPEVFNTGSPYNIPAGHSTNLESLIAHYEKKNAEMQEATMKRLREGKKEPDPNDIVRRGTY
ncbi:hypothetical protein MMC06_001800 [Schaereria dolodes]|nr:hypothetical protein [Schaereria dolodes]